VAEIVRRISRGGAGGDRERQQVKRGEIYRPRTGPVKYVDLGLLRSTRKQFVLFDRC
jgi:hypothetical protein